MLASFVPAFAAEETNLPYVEGLGYEVQVFEEDYTQPKLFSYDSGWKSFLGGKWRHGVGSRYVWSKYDHNNKTQKLQYKLLVVNSLIWVGQALEVEQKLLGKKLQVVIGLGLMLNNNK